MPSFIVKNGKKTHEVTGTEMYDFLSSFFFLFVHMFGLFWYFLGVWEGGFGVCFGVLGGVLNFGGGGGV